MAIECLILLCFIALVVVVVATIFASLRGKKKHLRFSLGILAILILVTAALLMKSCNSVMGRINKNTITGGSSGISP